ncbi:MAG: U32 family peptidase [Verrucomicrobia bacterium]|nr:U32 family peptidase [Verrucomicrobiota bacterium]
MKNKPPELLAPAGTPEAAWAALAYGADAVYAGLPRFSARAEAGNFTAEALDELIGYARHLGRRVYITFNTLVQQRELGEALETLATIRDLNASGVIVQDMGVVRLAQKNFPSLRLHASTQLAVHNLEGARQLASLGFKRVVLARELSLKAIEHISKNCGIETETFIHGALCYSYSGLCLFSSHLIGRSGNRGRCAYNCRQPFRCDGKENLPFSMKDFSAAAHLPELVSAGVASLKIEGRMKSPSYVAAVTDYYRRLTDGTLSADEQAELLSDIQTIFGRPSTDLYLTDSQTDPIEPVNAGHHGARIGVVKEIRPGGWLIFDSNRALRKYDGLKVETPGDTFAYGFAAHDLRLASDPETKRRFDLPEDAEIAVRLPPAAPPILPGTPIYCSISQAVRQRYDFQAPRPGTYRQRRPVNIHVFQTLEKTVLTASADGVQCELVLDGPFEAARQPEKSAAAIRTCFEKLGETDWQLGELTIEGSVFIPISILNDARRRLIADFSNHWKQLRCGTEFVSEPWKKEKATNVAWSVKARIFQSLENVDEFVLEIDPARPEEIEKALDFYAEKLRLALPVIIRDEEADAFRELIASLPNQKKWEAANVGGLNLLQGKQGVTADWPLYTLNTQAALQWNEQGVQQLVLSPEDDAENLFELIEQLGDAAIVPVYQHTPLMISATKPAVDGDELTDRSRRAFHIEQAGHEFVLTGDTPFSLTDHLDELKAKGARRFRIDLMYGIDSPAEAADLVRRITSGSSVPGHSGNIERTLQ